MDTNAIAEKYAKKYLESVGTHEEIGVTDTIRNAIAEATQGMWTDVDMKKAYTAGVVMAAAVLRVEANYRPSEEWLAEYKTLKSKNE